MSLLKEATLPVPIARLKHGLRLAGAALIGVLLRQLAEQLGLSKQAMLLLASLVLGYAACRLWLRGTTRCKSCSI